MHGVSMRIPWCKCSHSAFNLLLGAKCPIRKLSYSRFISLQKLNMRRNIMYTFKIIYIHGISVRILKPQELPLGIRETYTFFF